jgi:hypothetical protein
MAIAMQLTQIIMAALSSFISSNKNLALDFGDATMR